MKTEITVYEMTIDEMNVYEMSVDELTGYPRVVLFTCADRADRAGSLC